MTQHHQDDRELLTRVRDGDRAAMELLLTRYAPTIHRFGRRLCRDEDAAQEVLQDTLLTALRKLDTFRGDASLSTWLFAVARSVCLRRRRRRAGQPESFQELPETLDDGGEGPEARLARRQDDAAVARALDALPVLLREALALRDIEGLPVQQVADVLGISLPATKSRIHRARAALAAQLRPVVTAGSPCPDIARVFSQKLEGDADASLCARMEHHLAQCPQCTRTCDSLRSALKACHRLPAGPLPEAMVERLRSAIQGVAADPQTA